MDIEVSAEQEREFLRRELSSEDEDNSVERMNEEPSVSPVTEGNFHEGGEEDVANVDNLQQRNFENEARNENVNSLSSKRPKSDCHGETSLNFDESETEMQSMMKFAKFLEERGYIRQRSPERRDHRKSPLPEKANKERGTTSKGRSIVDIDRYGNLEDNDFIVTIYNRAVPSLEGGEISRDKEQNLDGNIERKRTSTSSEEDFSDEYDNIKAVNVTRGVTDSNDQFLYKKLVDCRLQEHRRKSAKDVDEEPRPSTSGMVRDRRRRSQSERETLPRPSPAEIVEERTREIIRRAESAKANMLQVPGKETIISSPNSNQFFTSGDLYHSVVVDEGYSAIGRHLDENMKRWIQEGEYIDFSRLIPKDRVLSLSDNRIELFNNNGRPELRSVVESEHIGSFSKWEQAFRTYCSIYTDKFPERAKQLLQYNHIIYSASLTYLWTNVYAYDIDF